STAVPHQVKLYGNVDGTALTYTAGTPPNAPTTINAGQVVDLGQVAIDFEIAGDHEFGVATYQLGAEVVDPGKQAPNQRGDPSQSLATAVEQYRKKYVFLAPADYDVNFVNVIQPMGSTVKLDGAPIPMPVAIGGSGFGVARVQVFDGDKKGAHVLESTDKVG